MYSSTPSLSIVSSAGGGSGGMLSASVLASFPPEAAHSVVAAIVKTVAPQQLGFAASATSTTSTSAASASFVAEPTLKTEAQINWFMEVVCHGLSLPLAEHETIKDCVNIYCEWLSALLPVPKSLLPPPVLDEPNRYARKIIAHLYHLFVPRKGEEEKLLMAGDKNRRLRETAQETIHKQAVLCHRVLRRIQDVVQQSQQMDRETWEAVLSFLLAINDALLAPPAVKDDVGDQLCERVLGVLYEIWLVACVKCFPSPPLWKTFREMCMNWRHRNGLVDQWNRTNMALTARLLGFMYGPDFPQMKIPDEDASLVPAEMTNDCVAQAWYRFLHSLGNPVDLSRPALVSQTQQFYQYAIVAESVIDPTHHPCLAALPAIFLKAMKGVSAMVDAYLGLPKASQLMGLTRSSTTTSTVTQMTPTQTMQSAFGSTATLAGVPGSAEKPVLAKARPKCNSILHLYGKWLFEAAFIGTQFSAPAATAAAEKSAGNSNSNLPAAPPAQAPAQPPQPAPQPQHKNSGGSDKRPTSLNLEALNQQHQQQQQQQPRRVSTSSQHSSLSGSVVVSVNPDSLDIPAALTPDRFESGRAEALGALCRIFCAKKTGEEILPVYLARFYLAVQQGLVVGPDKVVSEVLAMVLVNSLDLLRLDLDGVHVLLPHLVTALEAVLPERDLKLRPTNVQKNELRRAAINLLVAMLPLPSHFQTLPIKELVAGHPSDPPFTFASLKPRMINLLINALQVETEPVNTQLLLAGLTFMVQDTATLELAEEKAGASQNETSRQGMRNEPNRFMINAPSYLPSSSSSSPYSSLQDNAASSMASTVMGGGGGGSGPQSDVSNASDDANNDSAHTVFVRATYLVCHRLISSWKSDLNTSLAALELLSGLARIKIPDQDPLECKRAVKWTCDYIVAQCSRPPPAHSKDLHSSIVAAFKCLQTWLLSHSYLLKDKECLSVVMEVVEQGISGSKSRNKASDEPIRKEEKVLSPASRRVRDAAEAVMTCILEQVDFLPPSSSCSGAESLSSLLDEVSLLQHCNAFVGPHNFSHVSDDADGDDADSQPPPNQPPPPLPMSEAVQNFRYFVLDNSSVLAVLEEPLGGNAQEPQPTVTLLLRTSASRSAWTLQLRQLPRHKSGVKTASADPGRPLSLGEAGVKANVQPKYFPESIDRIPLCKADKSIPAVESVAGDDRAAQELERLSLLMGQQSLLEDQIVARSQEDVAYHLETECHAPEPCQEFQTARLILSHLGLMNMSSLRESLESPVPRLIVLENDSLDFVKDLECLDRLSPRTADTVHVFYARSGQTSAESILSNVHSAQSVHPHFLELLLKLGRPVNTWRHPGWTGHVTTSWRAQTEPMTPPDWPDHGGGVFNGDHYALYWADATAEMAFVVPSHRGASAAVAATVPEAPARAPLKRQEEREEEDAVSLAPSLDSTSSSSAVTKHDLNLDLTSATSATSAMSATPASSSASMASKKRINRQTSSAGHQDVKILLIWLERMEDHVDLPLDELLAETLTGTEASSSSGAGAGGSFLPSAKEAFVIFVQPLSSGLFRIKMQGQTVKINLATPLVDGMVVSRRCLGPLIRQTALNMACRKRLEVDQYNPPHVKRKIKVQELVQKYRSHMTEPEFYAHLFSPPSM